MFEEIIKKYKSFSLDMQQDKLNKQYKEFGLTDEILKKQIKINKQRNKYDIVDKKELEINSSDKYVQ